MVKKLLLAVVAASVFATPAIAQDAESFSGFRIEALGGYDSVGVSVEEEVAGDEANERKGGLLYGIGAGYDVSVGNFTVGVEAEISESTVGQDFAIDDEFDGSVIEGTGSLEAAHDIYVGARLGTRLSGSTLFYVKGGYSMAKAELNAVGSIDGEEGEIEADLNLDGLRLGAGFEGQLSNNVLVKLEYRYTDYSGGDVEVEGTSVDIGEAFDYIGIDRHQLVVGVGYRF